MMSSFLKVTQNYQVSHNLSCFWGFFIVDKKLYVISSQNITIFPEVSKLI